MLSPSVEQVLSAEEEARKKAEDARLNAQEILQIARQTAQETVSARRELATRHAEEQQALAAQQMEAICADSQVQSDQAVAALQKTMATRMPEAVNAVIKQLRHA